ncbi:MAG TPA: hypothetical protein VMR21_13225 [Vicinamibacteria bacterium]|nr:hypothetical protein [Vicinamibacteria bacterium]
MRKASWILIMVAAALTLLGSLASLSTAYFTTQDQIGPVTLTDLADGRPEVAAAIRARRGTAASYAAGFSVLLLLLAWGPYRRGDRWAWWAILIGTLTETLLVFMRIPFLQTRAGTGTAAIQLAVIGVALALDARRLRGHDDDGLARTI